jgi:hypothetical protein
MPAFPALVETVLDDPALEEVPVDFLFYFN